MMAEGIGPGDAVFLPAFTYTATAEVPLVLGATPVFVDVDPRTFQIDPAHLRARIAEVRACRQAAPARADRRRSVRPARRLAGAARHRRARRSCSRSTTARRASAPRCTARKLGAEADATAISFFPSKPLGAYGDGGALFTESADRAALYRSLRTHGEGTTRYEVLRTGMNGRLDTLQAAVLLAKLTVFPEELAARERMARYYDARLGNAVQTPAACRTAPAPGRSTRSCCRTARRATALQAALKRARRAERDLLSAPAASPAGLSRRTTTARRCRCRRIWRPASWRCRSIPT